MEVRCNFCGWDNPDGLEMCEKCNKPLQKEEVSDKPSFNEKVNEQATKRMSPDDVSLLKATVNEQTLVEQLQSVSGKCPECGYVLEDGVCSNCGYKETLMLEDEGLDDQVIENEIDYKKTVNPGRKQKKEGKKCRFVLTPISEDGEPEGDLIDYSGNIVSLNRSNTDPENSTITSQVQAVMTNIDGKWFVEDKSELKTTFVRAARMFELKNGDLILLGNQLYRFDDITS